MSFLDNLFKKGASTEEVSKPVEREANVAHPDLAPTHYYALSNQFAPVVISSQGVSCHIEYRLQGEYYVTTRSKGRIMLQESLNARDRKKLFVSNFDFKGLVGVHLHPAGMVFTLDEEKNAKGEVRPNQPPATILSGAAPQDAASLLAGRSARIDLKTVSQESPILIGSNNRMMHMMIKPVSAEGGAWGLYLSNANGIIRGNTLPSVVLQRESGVVVDRQFFIRLAASPDASIVARAWNVETIDPVLFRLSVDDAAVLTIEELFTTHGLSVVVGDGEVLKLGLLGDAPGPQEEMVRNQYAVNLGKLRDRTRTQVAELGQEGKLQAIRDHILTDVGRALRKENANGVVVLAMELAVKEVLAPLYNEAKGSDQITSVDHETVKLLNAISNELTGWLQTDSSIALSAAAITTVIDEIAAELPTPGLDRMMKQELPAGKADFLEEEQIHFDDLCRNAKTFLASFMTSSAASRDVFHLAKQLGKGGSDAELKRTQEELQQAMRRMMRETMLQTLIRLVIRGHLIRVEQDKRKALGIELSKGGEKDKLLGRSHLDDILKRYNDYSRLIDLAFRERMQGLINEAIKGFQDGTAVEKLVTINPTGFISYLVTLRSVGGNAESLPEGTVPAMTCLHSIPDAVPDIQVEQPDRGVAKGFVRVVHREGVLLEEDFAPKTVINVIPDGVPEIFWGAISEFGLRLMEYSFASDGRKRDLQQLEQVGQRWTRGVMLKIYNLLRGGRALAPVTDFSGFQEFMQDAVGVVEMRSGEESGEEILDLRARPEGMREGGMDIKKELRQVLAGLQKEGVIKADTFRFKQRMRSFAMSGGGQSVEIPLTITVRKGVISIEAVIDEKEYKRVFGLNGEEITGEVEVVQEDEGDKERAEQQRREQAERINRKALAHSLRTIEFFKDFSEYEKDRVAEMDVSFRMTQPQEILIREGTTDTAFYIVLRGKVAAVKGDLQRGKGKHLFDLPAGEMIGELAFLMGTPRSLNIVATDRGLLLRVDSALLNHLGSDSREKFKDQVINKLVRRLAETTDRLRRTPLGLRQESNLQARHGEFMGEIKQLSREETIERIDRIPFFDPFSVFEKRRITAFNTSFLAFAAGRDVILEGDIDTSFYILIDGRVVVLKGSDEVVELGPGEFFGDMAFLTSLPRTTGVRSKTDVLVMQVDQGLLKRLGSEIREKIKDRFIKKLCERVIQTTGLVV
ncbi:MAG: cyclic nucleotide-binding domain-containing protein [Magnetococcales bacterium]|nr:cyclic nucleotide-binding domain-containing protein [Magnetococcales bacterium]